MQIVNEVSARELSSMAMVGGNETKYRIVIDDDILKEWVGIGWIELRTATPSDTEKYPTVTRENKNAG